MGYGKTFYLEDSRFPTGEITTSGDLVFKKDSYMGKQSIVGVIERHEIVRLAKEMGIKPEEFR